MAGPGLGAALDAKNVSQEVNSNENAPITGSREEEQESQAAPPSPMLQTENQTPNTNPLPTPAETRILDLQAIDSMQKRIEEIKDYGHSITQEFDDLFKENCNWLDIPGGLTSEEMLDAHYKAEKILVDKLGWDEGNKLFSNLTRDALEKIDSSTDYTLPVRRMIDTLLQERSGYTVSGWLDAGFLVRDLNGKANMHERITQINDLYAEFRVTGALEKGFKAECNWLNIPGGLTPGEMRVSYYAAKQILEGLPRDAEGRISSESLEEVRNSGSTPERVLRMLEILARENGALLDKSPASEAAAAFKSNHDFVEAAKRRAEEEKLAREAAPAAAVRPEPSQNQDAKAEKTAARNAALNIEEDRAVELSNAFVDMVNDLSGNGAKLPQATYWNNIRPGNENDRPWLKLPAIAALQRNGYQIDSEIDPQSGQSVEVLVPDGMGMVERLRKLGYDDQIIRQHANALYGPRVAENALRLERALLSYMRNGDVQPLMNVTHELSLDPRCNRTPAEQVYDRRMRYYTYRLANELLLGEDAPSMGTILKMHNGVAYRHIGEAGFSKYLQSAADIKNLLQQYYGMPEERMHEFKYQEWRDYLKGRLENLAPVEDGDPETGERYADPFGVSAVVDLIEHDPDFRVRLASTGELKNINLHELIATHYGPANGSLNYDWRSDVEVQRLLGRINRSDFAEDQKALLRAKGH